MRRALSLAIAGAVLLSAATAGGSEISDAHRAKARSVLEKAFGYLRAEQNADGSWVPDPGPAVTGLVVAGMLHDRTLDEPRPSPEKKLRNPSARPSVPWPEDAPAIEKGLSYILAQQQDDGGIYTDILPSYNTSISLMALGLVRKAERVREPIRKAQAYLRELQWVGDKDPDGNKIDKQHPWYGGTGYGDSGRPDLSNTQMMLEGLYASGVNCKDPAFQRAMTFVTRLQGSKANVRYGDKIVNDGGFIYATSTDKDHIGTLQTYANPAETVDARGNKRLRTYGSMTYAGFKSLIYAHFDDRQDPRIQAALDWIRRNYTVKRNPQCGQEGYYYYLQVFAKALHVWGDPVLELPDGKKVNWAEDLIDRVATLQQEDGSFVNEEGRWMEDNPVLCTAYVVLALEHALK